MIRCFSRTKPLRRLPSSGFAHVWRTPRRAPQLPRFYYAIVAGDVHGKGGNQAAEALRYPVFERIKRPSVRAKASTWIALVEQGLPPHLRSPQADQTAPSLDFVDVAELLLAAQLPVTASLPGTDVLYQLGIVQGRWNAVVWLVKQLVETFPSKTQPDRLSRMLLPWEPHEHLDDITTNPIDLQLPPKLAQKAGVSLASLSTLDELTDDPYPEGLTREDRIRKDVLGQIWRSLGAMIIACAEEGVKPEILEIVAYLHHQEIMPRSIYSQKPPADAAAIQQPPTLHLLSSRILTSLSDAAWRAHEKLVVDEAKAKGRDYASLRPEIPGTAYRVRVAGLRAEVWLELILWSCLHGGWILEGAAILRAVCRETQPKQWRPLSWRALMPAGHSGAQDWGTLDNLLNARPASSMDEGGATPEVQRTVSSEVVNAYVDALLSKLDVGVGEHGASPEFVLGLLNTFRLFLERSNLRLGGGSWDAIVSRFVDSQGSAAVQPRNLSQLEALSPRFGGELDTNNPNTLPPYVLDGSAAMIGLFHRALQAQVKAGNVEGALRVFQQLQDYTDSNKRQSLEHFFSMIKSVEDSASTTGGGLFSSNYSIDYPGFHIRVPATILAPFLELVTDAQAYDIGHWLLFSKEVDGPLIPERMYNDPIISPASVRFATATNDKTLLTRLVDVRTQQNKESADGPTLSRNVLQSFLDAQIRLKRWSAARRILDHMRDTPYMYWNVTNLALLVREMLLQRDVKREGPSGSVSDLSHARNIFAAMIDGTYDRIEERTKDRSRQIDSLLVVFSAIDAQSAEICHELRHLHGHHRLDLPVKSFNIVLEGVVQSYGSAAARRLLGLFWSHAVRKAQARAREVSVNGISLGRVPPRFRSVLSEVSRQRTTLRLPGQQNTRVFIYGGLQPDLITIRIIFRRALEELKQKRDTGGKGDRAAAATSDIVPAAQTEAAHDNRVAQDDALERTIDLTPRGMVIWAVKRLMQLGMADEDIDAELNASLLEHEMHDLRAELPTLFHEAQGEEQEGLLQPHDENLEEDHDQKHSQDE